MKKIIFFSGSRAEYNIQYPILKKFQKNKLFKVYFIVAGSHTSTTVGNTSNEIKKDNINIFHKVKIKLKSNNSYDLTIYSIQLQKKMLEVLNKIKPDCIFLTSDRFETLSVALVSHFMKIPIIHLEGGDVTAGGTLDDDSRHAITKLAALHLVTNYDSKNRVIKLGEEPKRIIDIGFPPLNMIDKKSLYKRDFLEKKFSIQENDKLILFTYHPVPNELGSVKLIFDVLKKIKNKNLKIIITYPNFDPGYKKIVYEINKLKDKNFIVVKNLGRKMYFSILNYLGTYDKGFCMGNSSSGIKETMYFKCKTINLGKRQQTRLKTKNIYDSDIKSKEMISMINKVINLKVNYNKTSNPYLSKKVFIKIDQKISNFLKMRFFSEKKITY